jgi:hypothetical protein
MKNIAFIFIALLTFACNSKKSGEELAKENCSSCHKFPDPNLLDKKTWNDHVLVEMSYRLGMRNKFELLTTMPEEQFQSAVALNIYPDTPQMSMEEWQSIVDYYVTNAPTKANPQKSKSSISSDAYHFSQETFIQKSSFSGGVTSVKVHPDKAEIWVGFNSNKTLVLNANLEVTSNIRTTSPNVKTFFVEGKSYLVNIGKMYPNDQKLGSISQVKSDNKSEKLIDSLKRPVDMQLADFNGDGENDFLLCEYGYEAGQLVWVDGRSKKRHLLKNQAGARNVIIKDYSGDGKPDLLVLMAQAREGVSLFINKGMGAFVEKPILQFDAVWGSSYMEVADMNKDGADDIIISNGDNADYSITKKAYHGVHIYLNDQKNNFKEAYFYPLYGATKTVAQDFDKDGDLDLASIAFFTENEKGKNESFVYFQNQGNLQFKTSNLNNPSDAQYMTLDTGDYDKDGDLDIVVGNYQFGKTKPGIKLTPGLQVRIFKNSINR